MLLIHQNVFDEKATSLSPQANNDLLPTRKLFGDESFTYTRIFGSIYNPHVLHIYVPNNLLAREITYQTIVNGLSKVLKDAKKMMWPTYPISCGVYSLDNFKHAAGEIAKIQCLNFPFMPNRKYDPSDTSKNFTTQENITQFMHEWDKFDDLFEMPSTYAHNEKLAETQLIPEELDKFNQYRNKGITRFPFDLLIIPQQNTKHDKVVSSSAKDNDTSLAKKKTSSSTAQTQETQTSRKFGKIWE